MVVSTTYRPFKSRLSPVVTFLHCVPLCRWNKVALFAPEESLLLLSGDFYIKLVSFENVFLIDFL